MQIKSLKVNHPFSNPSSYLIMLREFTKFYEQCQVLISMLKCSVKNPILLTNLSKKEQQE